MTDEKNEEGKAEQHEVRVQMLGSMGRIEVGGHDVSDQVRAFTLHHAAGQRPQLVLDLSKAAAAGGLLEGLARVVVGEPPHPGDAAAVFLSAIDPGQLEQAALKRHDLMAGGPHEMTRIMLAQLIEWAKGTGEIVHGREVG